MKIFYALLVFLIQSRLELLVGVQQALGDRPLNIRPKENIYLFPVSRPKNIYVVGIIKAGLYGAAYFF